MFAAWMDYLMLLLQGSSVVITAGLLLFGIPALRQALLSQTPSRPKLLLVIVLFSLLAVYGTHAGKVISMSGGMEAVTWSHEVKPNEAVINFRDMVAVTAGLALGPWVGMIVGGIAGLERYSLGGFTALPCSIMSLVSGLIAGLFSLRAKTLIAPYKAAFIGAGVIVLQMCLILLLAKPFSDALHLVKQTGMPMMITTAVGCYAFQQVMRVLDNVRLQIESKEINIRAQLAEIRALNAQSEPHFLMNILNAIKSLIRIDPNKARHYVTMLGEFLHETRSYASRDTIAIEDELLHVKKYLDFQELRFSTAINYEVNIDEPRFLQYQIPPRSLLTLIENALAHGFSSESKQQSIKVNVFKNNNNLLITVEDNGEGIKQQNIQTLCHKPVSSKHKRGGQGLYNLRNTLIDWYGEMSNLEINNRPDHKGAIAKITLPINARLEEASS
jgi:LytS/YehU family sensor histidine kinase